jgi:hypothetical protein
MAAESLPWKAALSRLIQTESLLARVGIDLWFWTNYLSAYELPEAVMVPDFVKSLQAEEARLVAELQRSPLYQRLEAVREALSKLQYVYAEVTAAVGFEATVESSPVSRRGRQPSMAGTVTNTALEVFEQTGKRVTSGEILDILRKRGVQLDNPKPQAQIASIMSHDPRFKNASDGRGTGYGLAAWSEPEAAPAAPSQTSPDNVAATPVEEAAA